MEEGSDGVKRTEYWYGRAHTDLAMIKNWTLTPTPPPHSCLAPTPHLYTLPLYQYR